MYNKFNDTALSNPTIINATATSTSSTADIYNLRMFRDQSISNNAVFSNVNLGAVNPVTVLLSDVNPIADVPNPPNPTATTTFISIPKNNIIEASNTVDFKFNEAGDYLYNIQFDCYGSGSGSVVLQLVGADNTTPYTNGIIIRTINANSSIVSLGIVITHNVNDICKLRFSGYLAAGGAITINMSNLNVFIEKI